MYSTCDQFVRPFVLLTALDKIDKENNNIVIL
jgi:hypothetical protein